MDSSGKKVVLGITGSIAAVKSVEILRLLRRTGHDVRVVITPAARHFVGEAVLASLSGHPLYCRQFDSSAGDVQGFSHLELSDCDLMLVAPATANTIGKMAAGVADNLLLTVYLSMESPVMICPAMNQRMWRHSAVSENVGRLVERGTILVPPQSGELACGETGPGRMAEPQVILDRVLQLTGSARRDLDGVRLLVSAGGTREPIDAVRYITNRSSGKMGVSVAEAAYARGAEVTLVAANCSIPVSPGIRRVDVTTGDELAEALEAAFVDSDVLVMAAAVSDYRVSSLEARGKIHSNEISDLHLVQSADIVSALGTQRGDRMIVGFSAEHGAGEIERARGKMLEKDLDMMVFNDISRDDIGFDSDSNEVTILQPGVDDYFVSRTTKIDCAHEILDRVVENLN
jgi:phosphopantothenoylcysteine decarboxylase/phosphopantothenate--cysteine ligase